MCFLGGPNEPKSCGSRTKTDSLGNQCPWEHGVLPLTRTEIKHKDHDFWTMNNKQDLMKQACFNLFATVDNQFFKTLSKIPGAATMDISSQYRGCSLYWQNIWRRVRGVVKNVFLHPPKKNREKLTIRGGVNPDQPDHKISVFYDSPKLQIWE